MKVNRDLTSSIMQDNICIIGVPEEEEKEIEAEGLFEQIISDNFPNLEKEINIPVPRGTEDYPRNQQKTSQHHDI